MKKRHAGKVPNHLRGKVSLAVSPTDWHHKAGQLKRAAQSLFETFQSAWAEFQQLFERDPSIDRSPPDDSVIVLLLGFGIENLLKGLYAGTVGRTDVKNLRELTFPNSGHELEPIAKSLTEPLGIQFSGEEIDLLHVVEHYILWRGRYPSPRGIDDLIPMHEGGRFKKFYLEYPNDHLALLRLFDRLEEILAQRLRQLR
jgi:hypothetical protein